MLYTAYCQQLSKRVYTRDFLLCWNWN